MLAMLITSAILLFVILPLYVHYIAASNTGAYGPLYLYEHSPYDTIVLEVHCTENAQPSSIALDGLRSVLANYTGKKVEVEVFQDIPVDSVPSRFDDEGLSVFGEKTIASKRHHDTGWISGDIPMYIIYVNATGPDPRIKKDNTVIGVSYCANTFIVFKNNIATDSIERSVLIHEAGHLLGLDHDSDPHCVMTSVLVQKHSWLTGNASPPAGFCEMHRMELEERRRNLLYPSMISLPCT